MMNRSRVRRHKGRPQHPVPGTLPDDLYDYYSDAPAAHRDSPTRNTTRTWRVDDDWPERVPVTEVEVDIFERYFGDVLDRLFGPIENTSQNADLLPLTSDVNSGS